VSNITIRPAKLADLGALCELYGHLNPEDPPWPSEAAARDALADVLGQAGTTILVCELDRTCVSTCMLVVCRNFSRCGRPFAFIENVVTHKDQRRQGYGRRVVQHAIEAARQQGCYRVSLMTGSRRQETLRFYQTAGLQRDAKTAFEARFV
jgi:GNAT superfamily N-acetyltransferase